MGQTPYNAPVGVNYFHHSGTTAGVVIKTGGGLLNSLIVNSAIANAVVTLYDGTSTSGTIIATFTLAAVTNPQPAVTYAVNFATGLFLVVATDAADLTITYR